MFSPSTLDIFSRLIQSTDISIAYNSPERDQTIANLDLAKKELAEAISTITPPQEPTTPSESAPEPASEG